MFDIVFSIFFFGVFGVMCLGFVAVWVGILAKGPWPMKIGVAIQMGMVVFFLTSVFWDDDEPTPPTVINGCEIAAKAECPGADLSGADLGYDDLSQAILNDANLNGANLRRAKLKQATLSKASLSKASLHGADLTDADLTGADLAGADLQHAKLARADLTGADLTGADLRRADLTGADLRRADLTGTDLNGATLRDIKGGNLTSCPERLAPPWLCVATRSAEGTPSIHALIGPGADLSQADLSHTDLSGASLIGATLTGTSLTGATLHEVQASRLSACPASLPDTWGCIKAPRGFVLVGPGANFNGVDLSNTDLSRRDLTGAIFFGADLKGADLTDATLTDANLKNASTLSLKGGCPAALPDPWRCTDTSSGGVSLLGPGADLADGNLDVDLAGINLKGADLNNTSLAEASLSGAKTAGLKNCPESLPDPWRCLTKGEHVVLIGPGADLRDADLQQLDLRGMNLKGAQMSGARLGASLTSNLTSCPASLPQDWTCVRQPALEGERFILIGPGVNLTFANLKDAELKRATLTHARADDLRQGCPASLPQGWRCVRQPDTLRYALIGPEVDLTFANLKGADLKDADLQGATVGRALFDDHTRCPDGLPAANASCERR